MATMGTRPVCILSVGRSGTSLLARVINVLGVDLGPQERMLAPNEWNPQGFWEQKAIMELNDAILATLGGDYWNPPARPEGWEQAESMAPLRAQAAALVAEHFGEAARWGFKDPRTVFTLPLWRDVVGEMDYVLCMRDPREVVASLHSRNPASEPDGLLRLWLHANCEALRQTDGARRLILFYEDWFEEPRVIAARVARFLDGSDEGLTPDRWAQIADYFQPEQRTQRGTGTAVGELPFEADVLNALLRLLAVADRPGPARLAASLDHALAARRSLEASEAAHREENARLAEQVVRLEQLRAAQADQLGRLQADHDRRLAVLTSMQGSASWRLTSPLRAAKRRVLR